MRRFAALALALLALTCRDTGRPVEVFTSPEVAGTGLPQLLAERFLASTGVRAELQVVEGASLLSRDFGTRSVVVITNDPELLHRLEPEVRLKSAFARADFVVVGPESDPAKVREAASTPEAFRRIASGKRAFCSAADIPRYRAREEEVWKAAGLDPRANRRYRLCHGGMAQLLRDVASRHGYALVDRAAVAARPRAKVAVLLEGKPMLRNDYWVVLLDGRARRNPEWFTQWVMSWRGRDVVRGHRVDGERRFFEP